MINNDDFQQESDQYGENLEDQLASFRQQWHDELLHENDTGKSTKTSLAGKGTASKQQTIEEKAAELFLQGVKYERENNFSVAVYYYRQAVHLVPDIEFKIADYEAMKEKDRLFDSGSEEDGEDDDDEEEEADKQLEMDSISEAFRMLHVAGLCQQAIPQNSTHISALPTELLTLVIKWVITKDLDVKSLENLSLVCKWFYACARDEELWKTICVRVWGVNCSSVVCYGNNWRQMFFVKPRVRYNGVYISSNSYVRIGEQGVGSYYKPVHLVEYFKFLRFFTDGSVLLYTSADELQTAIQILQRPPYRDPAVHHGYYRVTGEDVVNVFFSRITRPSQQESRRRGRREVPEIKEQNFYMQLLIKDTKRKKNNQLAWLDYNLQIKNRKTGTTNDSDIDTKKFKPYIFSPVRSFCSRASSSL